VLAGLEELRASEDPQEKSLISLVEGFSAAARRQPQTALGHARAILAYGDTLGIGHEYMRWAWPLAARAARDLLDTATAGELLTLLNSYQPGYLPPMLRAERDLARARLAADDGDPAAGTAFAAAVSSLSELSTRYHLGHGLLDYAQYLMHTGDAEGGTAAVREARDTAGRLRCQPLLDRAADLTRAAPPLRTQRA